MEVDLSVLQRPYDTRLGHVLAKDPPTVVDARTGARVWRTPYTKEVLLALYQTLVNHELCVDHVQRMADLVRACEMEGICVPGATGVRALKLGATEGVPRTALGCASRQAHACAAQTKLLAETVANAILVWPRLCHGLKHGAGEVPDVGFTCSHSRVWVRFVLGKCGPFANAKDPMHALAQWQPRWLLTLLMHIGAHYNQLGRATDSKPQHDPSTFKVLARLLEEEQYPLLSTWSDIAREERVHNSGGTAVRSALPEQRALLAAHNFAVRCILKVCEHGQIITEEQRANVPVDVMFARACCSLARDKRDAAPSLAKTFSGLLADSAEGSTPERDALALALKRRKVKVRRWGEAAPPGVAPLIYPPGLRHEAQGAAGWGPCVLLEFT